MKFEALNLMLNLILQKGYFSCGFVTVGVFVYLG